ncbi:CLUMA_CG012762, isoform A [Clunio marinus]|uniref:CLUMA_CG012762, isoform A n=1 Tax=Clunio marinus TaxID=568069 RepID=A0A1J1IJX4_9DIPT|nr:CLUMA_CG012762, isoform A [Clunio marinus]
MPVMRMTAVDRWKRDNLKRSPKQSNHPDFILWKLFPSHFFRLQYIKSPDCGNAKNQDTAAAAAAKETNFLFCVLY